MRTVEGDSEAAVSRYRPGAEHRAHRIFDRDGAARFAFTGQGQTICAHFKLCRSIRCGGIACNHRRDLRNVARLVGQRNVEGLAVGLSRVQGDFETAISAHRPRANHCARCIFNRHRAADFAFTAQRQAINAHCKLCWRVRCGGIARNHWRDRRDVARLVGQGDVEGFAIFLRAVEDDFETAISPNRSGTNHCARCIFDRNGAVRFAFTGQGQAINADRQISWRRRCCGVASNHWRDR